MIMIIFIILIFLLGFCFGGLYELKNSKKLLEEMKNTNDEWYLLAQKVNKDWEEYCKTLIDEIKTLKGSANNDR